MGNTVLITGCSSGVGRAATYTFLDEDWEVYATARDPDELSELEEARSRPAGTTPSSTACWRSETGSTRG